jgi:hypothetical protein
MKEDPLFRDLFSDPNSNFETQLLQQTVSGVRAKRRKRQLLHAATSTVALLALLWLVWIGPSPYDGSPNTAGSTATATVTPALAEPKGYQLVISSAQSVTVVTSQPSYQLVTPRENNITFIHTEPINGDFFLNDTELLALFRGQPVGLVAIAPGHKELIFPGQTPSTSSAEQESN